jgi:hypothetical protein
MGIPIKRREKAIKKPQKSKFDTAVAMFIQQMTVDFEQSGINTSGDNPLAPPMDGQFCIL